MLVAATDARRLNEVVELQRKTEVQTATGGVTVSWRRLISTRAAVDSNRASAERAGQDGIVSQVDTKFTIRADVIQRFAFQLEDRILWKGVPWNPSAAPDNGLGGRLVTIYASTGSNHG